MNKNQTIALPTETQGNILIVDDTPHNLRLLSITLSSHGYEVRSAISGAMALMATQAEPPDLILLDIMMPDMDGYEVCERLKADPQTCNIPIIFISATDGVVQKVKAFELGGADYISKPFQVEEVLARVEHQLTICRLQKQLEEQNLQLEKSNLELANSNRELEQFAYAVSHDLQQPLQGVMTCSELLALKYEHCLDDKALTYIERMHNASLLMRQLIQGLLTYSQVGATNQGFTLIDCQVVFEKVLANLATDITQTQAQIAADDLPQVFANETQLIQLFQNLISNGIKFQHPGISPQIKISVENQVRVNGSRHQAWLFGVHDNGIGIASQNFEQIFTIFKRLHDPKDYPGTGIGLSTCKKIVEHHGGRIWLESQLDAGTSFYFTLPIR